LPALKEGSVNFASILLECTAMIEVHHLVKTYRELKAVQDVSFTVAKGEIVGFLGPNGAGKTTIMRMITGVLPPTSGSVKVAGFDVFEQPMEVKKRIGYLPETPPVYTEMTVRSYLRFVAEIKGVPSKVRGADVDQAAEKTNCDKYIHRVIGNLSKGQRQRVGIAQALLGNPEVLILDEPTVGLDPGQIIEVRELIKSLAGKHTIILSTHILPEVVATCQRVVMLALGKVVADDTLQGLQRGHASAATADGRIGPAPSLEEIFLKLTTA
jgi:ABC-2 type transport system ATP-binding protein